MLQVLNMIGKVRIKFKVEVIDNACLVARAAHLMTHGEFAEGYSLIRDMQGSDFLTALRMLAEQEAMVKKLSDFKEKHKGEKSESVALLLTRALKKATKRQYPCSRRVPWKAGLKISPAAQATPTR